MTGAWRRRTISLCSSLSRKIDEEIDKIEDARDLMAETGLLSPLHSFELATPFDRKKSEELFSPPPHIPSRSPFRDMAPRVPPLTSQREAKRVSRHQDDLTFIWQRRWHGRSNPKIDHEKARDDKANKTVTDWIVALISSIDEHSNQSRAVKSNGVSIETSEGLWSPIGNERFEEIYHPVSDR